MFLVSCRNIILIGRKKHKRLQSSAADVRKRSLEQSENITDDYQLLLIFLCFYCIISALYYFERALIINNKPQEAMEYLILKQALPFHEIAVFKFRSSLRQEIVWIHVCRCLILCTRKHITLNYYQMIQFFHYFINRSGDHRERRILS